MKKKLFALFSVAILGIFLQNCRKDQSKYHLRLGSLEHLPIEMNEFISLTPLGFVSPPGHVFPNDHMGFYYVKDIKPVTIYSPGNVHLSEIRLSVYNPGQPNETSDYSLSFGVNGESIMILGHISQLSPKLTQLFGDYSGCEEYSAGTTIVKACKKQVSIEIKSGEVIGYSNLVAGQQALDMGMYVNNKAVSPLDYFAPAIKTQLESRLMGAPNAEFDGILRADEPLAGEVYQDITGALQGVWYKISTPKTPESPHIAFIKSYIKPDQLRISFGNSVPVFGPGVWKFDQQSSGLTNRAFKDVKADGQIYCYDPLFINGGGFPNNSFIVKVENNKTLYLEKRDCNCTEQLPYQFTAEKLTYVRY